MALSPVGIAMFDEKLRYLWANNAQTKVTGLSLEDRIGRRLSEVMPGGELEAVEAKMQEVLDTGTPVFDFEYAVRVPKRPHRDTVFSTSIFRFDDVFGVRAGVCCVLLDITDRTQARERLMLLFEAGSRIGATLDVTRTAQELAEIAVPRLADFVTVDLYETILRGTDPWAGPPLGGDLVRCGQQSTHEGCPESVYAIHERLFLHPAYPAARSLASGRTVLESVGEESAEWIGGDPDRAAKVRAFGLCSMLAVPIVASGVKLGAATFIRLERRDAFEPEDIRLAEEFVDRAAVYIDNARRYTREHVAALSLQRTLLPHGLRRGASLDVATRYRPANAAGTAGGVGGDWFDVIPLSGARTALVVGDVVGHGINAAATMGRLRTAVHTLADMDLEPDELLAHLDDLVVKLIDEEEQDECGTQDAAAAILGATCLYAVYDPVTARCTLARAGHPPPAIVTPDGEVTFPELPAGPPLGLGTLPFESAELVLPGGSLVALYTDGLIESRNHDTDASVDRFARVLASPERCLETLCDNTLAALLTEQPDDDVALLVARTFVLGADKVAHWDLSSDPAIVSDARTLAGRQLAEWGLDDLQFNTELIVSELVTNAIRYGAPRIELRLIRHNVLTCEVSDGSSTSPRVRHARATDEGGRGLFLVAQMTQRWGTRSTHSGKTIWAEQEIHDAVGVAP